jgi:transposase
MSKSRPSYSNEFKNDAAKLVLDQQYSVNDACKAVGVGYTALRRWVAQLDAERGGITLSARATPPLYQTSPSTQIAPHSRNPPNPIWRLFDTAG